MSGINHLTDIYKKKGKDFIDNLFNKYVVIQEKIDLSRLSFVKKSNGSFDIYKRDTSKPIDKVDRTLMSLYENAINFIETLPEDVKDKIPVGWRFGTEYGLNKQSHEIAYDRLPKNNLILSDIITDKGETIQDKEVLDYWADLLNIERSPIFFQGKLTEDQKIKLLDFLNTPFEQLIERFKTQSFVNYILSIINESVKTTTLNDDLNKPIEGLVFRFGLGEKSSLAKLVDPLFQEIAKKKANVKQTKVLQPNDIYNITLADLTSYLSNANFNKIHTTGFDANEKYISCISTLFNQFINEYGYKYKGLDFEEPDYLKKSEFKLNTDLITNEDTKTLIGLHPSYESLFRIMLNAFRKSKTNKSVNSIFTEGILYEFNSVVEKIENYVNGIVNENTNTFLTFAEFRVSKTPMSFVSEEEDETQSKDSTEEEVDKIEAEFKEEGDTEKPKEDSEEEKVSEEPKDNETPVEEPKEEIDPKQTEKELLVDKVLDYFSTPTETEIGHLKELRGKTSCAVFVGRFQPFHNGHFKTVNYIKQQTGLPVILVVINSGNQNEKNALPERIQKTMAEQLKLDGIIEDYIFLKTAFFGTIIRSLRPKYEVDVFACGEDRKDSYNVQLDYMRNKAHKINMNPDVKLIQVDRISSATEVRDIILSDDFAGFKRMVPKCLINLWEVFRSEIYRPTPNI